MHKIYINGRFLAQPFTGVQRFATEMLKALDRQLQDRRAMRESTWTLLVPPGTDNRPTLQNIEIVEVGIFRGALWEQFDLPRFLHGDPLINFGSTGPLACRNQFVTIHDAEVVRQPDNFRRSFRLWYRFLLPRLGQRARKIITVSEFSKSELAACFGIPLEKCVVIHNSAEHINAIRPDTSILERLGVSAERYVLCFGAGKRNKNSKSVIHAMGELDDLDLHLVLVGKSDTDVFQAEFHQGDTPFHEAGHITDEELRALYQNAMCFVFPSLYEGFGIPPIEAMFCHCPVIASNKAAIPEVCGDAALLLDSIAPAEIARAIRTLATQPSLREQRVAAGLKKAHEYSWETSARRFLDILEAELSAQS
ncbi:MAG: glycosyltransferase family 4 protein [Woeseiaceae bacterium]|nr:glycosyltransferase family 4 protein [Woeseiaceae bacterium]